MSLSKKILESVELPWQLDLQMTNIKINATDLEVKVSVTALFQNKQYKELLLDFKSPFFIAFGGHDATNNFFSNENLEISDADNQYDWSLIPFYEYLKNGSFEEYHKKHDGKWKETQICPDPHVYFIKNSILSQKAANRNLQHYLLMGNDLCVDVVAEKLMWQPLY